MNRDDALARFRELLTERSVKRRLKECEEFGHCESAVKFWYDEGKGHAYQITQCDNCGKEIRRQLDLETGEEITRQEIQVVELPCDAEGFTCQGE